MKVRLLLFILMLFCCAAFAGDLPVTAVYVTGDVSESEKSAPGTRMAALLANSGRCMGIERSGAFPAGIAGEQGTRRSGAVDGSRVGEPGRRVGVKFACIAAIAPAFWVLIVPAACAAVAVTAAPASIIYLTRGNCPP
ncbi:MAG: hypothetical protein FWC04_08780, partial [Chitinispirillia bacterium]|nr:hypothetical protein [Chitinispirillia bacterium]